MRCGRNSGENFTKQVIAFGASAFNFVLLDEDAGLIVGVCRVFLGRYGGVACGKSGRNADTQG